MPLSPDKQAALARRIRALLAKTEDRGASEAEMLAAMAKAHELMARHQLSLSDLELREEGTRLASVAIDKKDYARRLMGAVAQFCDCKVWTSNHTEVRFLGLSSDSIFAEWLLRALVAFVERASLQFALEEALNPLMVESFAIGCCERIRERLLAETDARRARARGTEHSALVVTKGAMVEEAFAALGLRLGRGRPVRGQVTHSSAFALGREKGGEAQFTRPLAGSKAAPLLLGGK